jgi:hypothetical protein
MTTSTMDVIEYRQDLAAIPNTPLADHERRLQAIEAKLGIHPDRQARTALVEAIGKAVKEARVEGVGTTIIIDELLASAALEVAASRAPAAGNLVKAINEVRGTLADKPFAIRRARRSTTAAAPLAPE